MKFDHLDLFPLSLVWPSLHGYYLGADRAVYSTRKKNKLIRLLGSDRATSASNCRNYTLNGCTWHERDLYARASRHDQWHSHTQTAPKEVAPPTANKDLTKDLLQLSLVFPELANTYYVDRDTNVYMTKTGSPVKLDPNVLYNTHFLTSPGGKHTIEWGDKDRLKLRHSAQWHDYIYRLQKEAKAGLPITDHLFQLNKVITGIDPQYFVDRDVNVYSTKSGWLVKLTGSLTESGRIFTFSRKATTGMSTPVMIGHEVLKLRLVSTTSTPNSPWNVYLHFSNPKSAVEQLKEVAIEPAKNVKVFTTISDAIREGLFMIMSEQPSETLVNLPVTQFYTGDEVRAKLERLSMDNPGKRYVAVKLTFGCTFRGVNWE